MSRRRAAAAGLALAMAAGLWLFWPAADAPRGSPARASESSSEPRAGTGAPAPGVPERAAKVEAPKRPHRLTVIDADTGLPLAQVLVRLTLPPDPDSDSYLFHGRSQVVAEARTDAAGVADLRTDAALEAARVAAYKDFYEYGDAPFSEGMTVALEPLPRLRGRVVNERGEPVSAARVTTTRHKLTATTDGAGKFELAAPETEWLYAEKDDALAHGEWVENKEQEVVLTLISSSVPRRVVDTAGQPLDKVAIDFKLGALEVHRETGPDGVWRLPKLDARFDATFKKAGYATHHEPMLDLDDRPRNVTLSRAGRVEGVVVRPDGTPVAGARILGFDNLRRLDRPPPLVTGPDGRFVRDDLERGELHLVAGLGEEIGRLDRTLAEGQHLEVRLVLFPRPEEVELEVVDARGKPVPGALWFGLATSAADSTKEFESDLGAFELPLGRYRIAVATRSGAKGAVEVAVERDMAPVRVTLDAPVETRAFDGEDADGGETAGEDLEEEEEPPTHSLKVRVTGPTGVSIGNVEVSCLYDQGLTREDGVYECHFTPDENSWPLQVRAWKGDQSGFTRAVGNEAEVVVVLRAARDLKVRFDGALPRRPCRLQVNSPTEADTLEVTGNPMVLPARSAVRAYLCLECQGELESDGEVRLGCGVSEGQPEVVVPVGAPGTLALKVLDSEGQPLEEPVLYVDRESRAAVAPKGEVRVPVVPGTHVLVINVRGKRERAELPFSIRSGETTSLGTVRLK